MSYLARTGTQNLSKGELQRKLQATRRTQIRRRAEAKDQRGAVVESALSYAAGYAMAKGFSAMPQFAQVQGLDTKLIVGVAGSVLALTQKGDIGTYAGVIGHSALSIAGYEMGLK